MVDEQNAFQMVHLVLEADGDQPIELFLMLLAVFVEPARAETSSCPAPAMPRSSREYAPN